MYDGNELTVSPFDLDLVLALTEVIVAASVTPTIASDVAIIEVIPTHHILHSLKVPTILNVLMTPRMGEELWRIKETMFTGDEDMHRAMVHLADIHTSGNIDVTCIGLTHWYQN
ncbi:hypothetical protein DYB28_013567 [Aphanomyces astaci]|uniref:Uncharacterized protein n=1 Tax=Aphanomyces astaci TaxID=112090 RepID=A0A9X8E7T6_APHAT|nr:hypothetical protein DYB28_013567 [Aphanomyces astaci]